MLDGWSEALLPANHLHFFFVRRSLWKIVLLTVRDTVVTIARIPSREKFMMDEADERVCGEDVDLAQWASSLAPTPPNPLRKSTPGAVLAFSLTVDVVRNRPVKKSSGPGHLKIPLYSQAENKGGNFFFR